MIIAILAVLGLVFGSFTNALVWRIHKQATVARKKSKKISTSNLKPNTYSIVNGRSMCPQCKHELAAKDLVPVLSWLGLKGKCRYCKKPIHWQYPAIELITAALFVGSYLAWPYNLNRLGWVLLGFWLVYLVFFVALAVYDLKWMLLPDKLVYPLTLLAVLQVLVAAVWLQDFDFAANAVLSGVGMFGLFWLLFQVSQGKWIGGGDVKIAVALGLIVGTPVRMFLLIFIASLLGTLASLPLAVSGKAALNQQIPFGPYLLAATVIVVLFGQKLIDWYQGLFII